MTNIQRLSALGFCVLLTGVVYGHEGQCAEWSAPTTLGPVVNSANGDFFPGVSKDGLSLYFTSSRPVEGQPPANWNIYVSKRASVGEPWGAPQILGPTINTDANEGAPVLSADGRRMYFASNRPGGFGGNDLYVSRRRDKHDDFGWETPKNLGPEINTAANEASPALFEDPVWRVTTLYFDSNRPGGLGPFTTDGANNGNDIYAAFLLFDDTFLWPHLVRSLSSEFADRHPTIRSDGLEVFFHSDRPGGKGLMDLWASRRAKTWHEWGEPVNVSSLNTAVNDAGPALSFDGRTLYFQSAVPEANFDLFAATREFRECRPPCVCDHCDVHEACRK